MLTPLNAAAASYLNGQRRSPAEPATSTARPSGSGTGGATAADRGAPPEDIREFSTGCTSGPSRTRGANPAGPPTRPRAPRAVLSWRGAGAHRRPRPGSPSRGRSGTWPPALPDQARANALYFATHRCGGRGVGRPLPVGRYWRAAWSCSFNYGVTPGPCEVGPLPRAHPLAARVVGRAVAGTGRSRSTRRGGGCSTAG